MIDSANVPVVASHETLARYVLSGNHIRAANQTLKPDAFIPPPHGSLSVTRHLSATEDELWAVGKDIARSRVRTLHGRGDVGATVCINQDLAVEADPVGDNPNHANIVGWPADKPARKIIAQEIAAAAKFVPVPRQAS